MANPRDTQRPTVHDVAEAAGVSLATVDRVLNARAGVSAKAIEKVNNAVAALGYSRNLAAAKLARRSPYRFLFLLPASDTEVIHGLERKIRQAVNDSRSADVEVEIDHAPLRSPEQFAEKLAARDPETLDGVAVMAPHSPELVAAIEGVRGRGKPVVALISSLPSVEVDHFIGIDNVAAGRTAAVLLGRFSKSEGGRVLVISGSTEVGDHNDRLSGFCELMADRFPHLTVLPPLQGWDDPARVEAQITSAFAKTDDIVAIYSLAGGNRGLVNALLKNPERKDLVVIAHEITKSSKSALKAGLIDALIVQSMSQIVKSAIRILKAPADVRGLVASEEKIRIEIILKENLPQPGIGEEPAPSVAEAMAQPTQS